MRNFWIGLCFLTLNVFLQSAATDPGVLSPYSKRVSKRETEMTVDETLNQILSHIGEGICYGHEEQKPCIEFELCGESGAPSDSIAYKVMTRSGNVYKGSFDMHQTKYCFGSDLDLILGVELTRTGQDAACLHSVKITSRWQDEFEVLSGADGNIYLHPESPLYTPCFTARTCPTNTHTDAETTSDVKVTESSTNTEKTFHPASSMRYRTICYPGVNKLSALRFNLIGSDKWCVDDLLVLSGSNNVIKLVNQKAEWIEEDSRTFAELNSDVHRLCYPDSPELDVALCYPRCENNYIGVGPVCWENCPPLTTDIGAVCTKYSYGRGVGVVPTECSGDKDAGLCYDECNDGYYGVGPVCWQTCPSDYVDTGAFCHRDAHIYASDNSDCPWYDKCGLFTSCSICSDGYHNDGCFCRKDVHIYAKDTYGRGVGLIPGCLPEQDHDAGLCYDKCEDGYTGVGPVCWAECTGGLLDTGAQCQKGSYGRGVGKPINCLKLPTLKATDFMGPYRTMLSLIKTIDQVAHGKASFEEALCQTLYDSVSPLMRTYDSVAGCMPEDGWNTMFASYSLTGSAFASAALSVTVNRDFNTGVVRCQIGFCLGMTSSINVGFGASLGMRGGLPTPGSSQSTSIGAKIFGNGFSMQFGHSIPETTVKSVSFGMSVGADAVGAPLSFGRAVCYSAPCAYYDLENPDF